VGVVHFNPATDSANNDATNNSTTEIIRICSV
jgi:hypothetical protein